MKKLSNIFSKENLINYVLVFYIISIILDLHIFYNSISTLIRVIFISGLFSIIYIKYSSKKERKILLLYFILLLLYIIFHLINCYKYNNILSELLYFYKMSMNIFIIYIVYKLNIDKNKFYKIITISAFIISFSIIICNIFKIGYTSYEFVPIEYNIFEWFNNKELYFYTSSSKGFFHLTNQISAILVLYLPILLVYLKEKINVYKIISIISVIISLVMLGTRVSTYSTFIIISISLVVYFFTSLIKKEMNYKYVLLLLLFMLISFGLYTNCPLLSRNSFYDKIFNNTESTSGDIVYVDITKISNEEFYSYLKKFNIVEEFYKDYYPLEENRDFYESYLSLGTTKINDTRFLEESIIKRVKENNNNPWDNYLGIGYDRVISIFNIESDYTMQYYSLGIIGLIIILGVNIILLLYCLFKIIFNINKYFNYENILILFASMYFLVMSYYTGNILNSISCIIPISFVIGYYLSYLKSFDKKKDYEYYLGFKTSTDNKNNIINKIFKENNQVILYNINPLICLNFRNNNVIKNAFNKEKYNIPDGNGIVLSSILKSNNIKTSIPGIEMLDSICEKSVKEKYSIYLYGAKEDSVSKAKVKLEEKYKNINIVGYINGYTDKNVVIKDIIKKKPDILFVALGSPRQEEFILNNKEKLKDIKVIMPVGGSFDVISGNLKRAPKIYRKLKIEWLYRMIKEPKRFKQLFGLFYFIILVLFANSWYNKK